VILIEANRVDALGNEAAAIGVDKPEHTVTLGHTKEPARAEAVVGDAAPFGSLQPETPVPEQ
jgi:hypothetical protein